MKIRYFPDTDTLYINLADRVSSSSEAGSDNLIVDFDELGKPVGVSWSTTHRSATPAQSRPSCRSARPSNQPDPTTQKPGATRSTWLQRADLGCRHINRFGQPVQTDAKRLQELLIKKFPWSDRCEAVHGGHQWSSTSSTASGPASDQMKQRWNWSLMRMLCCPARGRPAEAVAVTPWS